VTRRHSILKRVILLSLSRERGTCQFGFLATVLSLGISCCAWGQLEISVSPTRVGSGARAAGMADAFVAIADDATAASWNPAGLVQLERPELSLVGSFNAVQDRFNTTHHPETEDSYLTHNFDLNYFSFAYPLPFLLLGRNMVVSLNYQRQYDFTRDFGIDYDEIEVTSTGRVVNRFGKQDVQQRGGLSTISPAFAVELTHRISIGAALNIWCTTPFSENSWELTSRAERINVGTGLMSYNSYRKKEEYRDFEGINATLGLLWRITEKWSVGLRYDTAFTGEAGYKSTEVLHSVALPQLSVPGFVRVWPETKKHKRHIRFPDSLAIGIAWRATDRLTLAFDVARTDWNDFWVRDNEGVHRSLVDNSNLDEPLQKSKFDPTYTVRLGTEYIFLPKQPEEKLRQLWTLRGGLFYDEEPASGRSEGFSWPGDNGDGNPDRFYGFALGGGLQLFQRVNIDCAYQFRYGNHVNADFVREVQGFDEEVFQHRVLLSTVVYF